MYELQKKGVRCCPQSLLFGADGGTCSQVSTWLRWRTSKDGRQPHCVGSKCKAFVAQSAKVTPTKKDPKVFLVLVVGLEPTRSPTRPLNVRVCHSATPASMDYVSIIFFCCQEILKKNLLLVSWKKQTNPKESLVHLAQLLHHTFRKYSHVHLP